MYMPEYVKRPKTFFALQYNGEPFEDLVQDSGPIGFREKGSYNSAPEIYVYAGKRNKEEKVYLSPGDWVVYDNIKQTQEVYSDEDFKLMFVEAPVTRKKERIGKSRK